MRLDFFLALLVTTFVVMCTGFTSAKSIEFDKNIDSGFRRLRMSADAQEERGAGDAAAKVISSLKGGGDEMIQLSKIFAKASKSKDGLQVTDGEVANMLVLVKKANAGGGAGLTDDEVAKFAMAFAAAQKSAKLTNGQVFKLSKMIADAKKVKEAAKVSDDEVAKVSAMFKKANAGAMGEAKFTDDEVAKLGGVFAAAQKGVGLSDKQIGKLVKLFAKAKQAPATSDENVTKLSQELAVVAQKDKKSWSTFKKVIVSTLGVSVGGAVIYGTIKLTTKDSASTTAPTSTTSSSA